MHKSNIPPLPQDTPKAVLDALDEYNATANAYQAAENGNPGDRELEAAQDADRQLLAQAVRDGKSPGDVGTPNHDAAVKRRESYRIAEQELRQQFSRQTIETAAVLVEHRDELIALAVPAVQEAEARFREKLEQLDQARDELNRQSAVLSWCQAITLRNVPHNSGTLDRPLQVGITSARWGEMRQALLEDAARVDALVRIETKRLEHEQREASAAAANARIIGQRTTSAHARGA